MTNQAATDTEAGDSKAPKSPLDLALDIGVFAPLGFALEFRRILPELAEAGRRQLAFSQTLGRAALTSVARAASSQSKQVSARGPAPTAAVPGYDDLTAREIVALLDEADDARVEWIASREADRKARVTVIRAAAARQSA